MQMLMGFSLGCLTLIFIIVARDFRQLAVAKVFLALLIAGSAFLVRSQVPIQYAWLTDDIMTVVPALFWLLCQMAFSRRPHFISVWSVLALYSFVAPAITRCYGANIESAGSFYILGWYIPRFAEYLVILNGLWVIVVNWKDDLIESRRLLRAAMLITVGFTGLWVTISMNTGHGSSLSLPIVVSLCTLISGALLLKGREGVLLGAQTSIVAEGMIETESAPVDASKYDLNKDEDIALKLKLIMEEGFYRTEKLTLKLLSKKMALPEYKLRTLINSTFNYRNFNDYINQLRIEEASQRLIQEPDTPIQNIALDIGYRTLSSFNRAFKEIQDQTPTDYRCLHTQNHLIKS